MNWIVLLQDAAGFEAVGPFESGEAAESWASEHRPVQGSQAAPIRMQSPVGYEA